MLQNPIHLRLEKLTTWQHVTFMACLCERMYPNYTMFCQQTEFGDPQIYRRGKSVRTSSGHPDPESEGPGR